MKFLLLVSFLSFVLCAIQQESTEIVFNNYSRIEPSISKEEFVRIATFISRVEAAKDDEPVVREDFSMLSTLGFTNLFNAFHPPKSQNNETASHFTWGDVNAFIDGLQTQENTPKTDLNSMTLAQVLRFSFCFECVDSLEKEESLGLHYLLDFLQAGSKNSRIVDLATFYKDFGPMLDESD